MSTQPKIAILGAGPTGLGAAWRLHSLGYDDWTLYGAESTPGGLASSVIDASGFTWDLGVHVIHSHYETFDRVMDEVLPGGWLEHQRNAYIWLGERYISYPLQSHIDQLPPAERQNCMDGLESSRKQKTDSSPKTFSQWILRQFGQGVADVFMFPYNRKVWGCELTEMGTQWLAERVADNSHQVADAKGGEKSWGPNAKFRFPARGGTGAFWNAIYARLPESKKRLGKKAVTVDADSRTVVFADGSAEAYDFLISTMPLDRLLICLGKTFDAERYGKMLRRSATDIVGLGFSGRRPEALAGKSWIYFPQPELPFHRLTMFSEFSPHNVPAAGDHWSLIAEAEANSLNTNSVERICDAIVTELKGQGVVPADSAAVNRFYRRLDYAYPVPTVERDAALREILPELERLRIFSRGRFGAWKYEIGNMDHSFMQGYEAVDRILFGREERVLHGDQNEASNFSAEKTPR